MEKKILIVASGMDHSMILSALHKNNLTENDVRIIQEDSDEAIELLAGEISRFPLYHDPEAFRIEPIPMANFNKYIKSSIPMDYSRREIKGGKKNKKNWKY